MNIVFSVFVFVLFFILTPGVLLRLPSKGSKTTVALVHGLIFAIILAVSGHFFWKSGNSVFEGATGGTTEGGTTEDKVTPGLEDLRKSIADAKKRDITEKKKEILLNKLSVIMKNQTESIESKMTPEEINRRRQSAWKQQCPKTHEMRTGRNGLPEAVEVCITNEPPSDFMPNGV
jgi:hypothetical protein